jgi:hypothetical protein
MEFDRADGEEIIEKLDRVLKTLEEKRKHTQLNIQQEVKMAKDKESEKEQPEDLDSEEE